MFLNSALVARPVFLLKIIRLRLLVILVSLMKAIDSSDMRLRLELSPLSIDAYVLEVHLLLAQSALVNGCLQTGTAA